MTRIVLPRGSAVCSLGQSGIGTLMDLDLDQDGPTPALPDNANRVLFGLRALLDGPERPADGRVPPERELSSRFGVSRRAVRRALEVLEAEGLVWRRQGKGTFLGQPPHSTAGLVAALTPEAAMEARLALEPALAALCAGRAGPWDVIRLRALSRRAETAESADAGELWDGAFHRLIASVAGNPLLTAAFAAIDEVRAREDWQERRARVRSPRSMAESFAQHEAIVRAIERGDAEAAREAMTAHLASLAGRLQGAP